MADEAPSITGFCSEGGEIVSQRPRGEKRGPKQLATNQGESMGAVGERKESERCFVPPAYSPRPCLQKLDPGMIEGTPASVDGNVKALWIEGAHRGLTVGWPDRRG